MPESMPFTAQDGAIVTYSWLVAIAGYVYFAFMQQRIAQKIGLYDCAWWAYVPILNTFLLIKMADKPTWWFVLLLIPVANVVTFFLLWMNAARACGHAPLWGFLTMVPVINLVSVYVMAFTRGAGGYEGEPSDSQGTPPYRQAG